MPINLPKCSDGILLRDFRPGDAEALADIEYNADVKRFLRPMTYRDGCSGRRSAW